MIYLHIILACISVVITGLTAFVPTTSRLIYSAASIVLTLASGILLGALDHTVITRVCMSGLIYLAFESAGITYSVIKLQKHTEGSMAE